MSDLVRSGPVRYARAPRFAPPERTDPAVVEPTDGSICPQPPSRLEHVMGPPPEDPPQGEDCLALSVVAPATPGPHPVLVFLHGGGFSSGAGLLSPSTHCLELPLLLGDERAWSRCPMLGPGR